MITKSTFALETMETSRHVLIGQILVDLGYVNLYQVNEARRMQLFSEPEKRMPLGEVLINLGYVNNEQVEKALRHQEEKSF